MLAQIKEKGDSVFWLSSHWDLERDLALNVQQLKLLVVGQNLPQTVLKADAFFSKAETEHALVHRKYGEGLQRLDE